MSLLDQLWDDTVAGPRPDTGLGKLRKHSTFSARSNSGKEVVNDGRAIGEGGGEDAVRVTRSIMIVKPPEAIQKDSPPVSPSGSTPSVSPAGSTHPVSPFTGAGGREALRFRRRSASFTYEKANGVGPRSPPPPYDL